MNALPGVIAITIGSIAFAPPPGATVTKVAFARLDNGVGFSVEDIDSCGFDGKTVSDLVEKSRKSGCAALMLEIESPGGLVHEGEKIVDTIIDAQAAGLTVIAWYGQAFSAASWIPFAAKIAVCKPTGTCGGSVIWAPGPDGKPSPVDAKMASATIGKVKNAARAGSKEPILVDAIFRQEAEVWLAADGSLHTAEPEPGSKCLDDSKTVLNMDARMAQSIGFARGTAMTRDEAVRVAGLASITWVELNDIVTARAKRVKDTEKKWESSSKKWFGLLGELFRKIDKAIDDSRASAQAYAQGAQFANPNAKTLGSRARKELREFRSEKLGPALSPSDFDDALVLSGHGPIRAWVSDLQQRTAEGVRRIIELLETRELDKIDEAESVRDELRSYLESASP